MNGLGDFDGFYQKVSEVQFSAEEALEKTLLHIEESGILYQSRIIFCVLHEPDGAVQQFMEQLERAGALLVLYIVTEDAVGEYQQQGDERRRIMVIPVQGGLEGKL